MTIADAPAGPPIVSTCRPSSSGAGPSFLGWTASLWLAASACGGTDPQEFSPGVTYQNDRLRSSESPVVPWSVQIVKIDRAHAELELHATLATDQITGVTTLSEQARTFPAAIGKALAGVNGDYFRYERTPYNGDPRGFQITRGELISGPGDREVFWLDARGEPHAEKIESRFTVTWPGGDTTPFGLNEERRGAISVVLFTPIIGPTTFSRGGRELVLEREGKSPWLPLQAGENYTVRVKEVNDSANTRMTPDILVLSLSPEIAEKYAAVQKGAVLKISTATLPDLKGAKTAIGGGPVLVHEGKVTPPKKSSNPLAGNNYSIRSMFERHPRSAMGWNKKHFFLVQVDGRQPGLSLGMTLAELGDYMARLGCEEVLNFDGGGSSTLWANGKVRNSPCDGSERSTANALLLIKKTPAK